MKKLITIILVLAMVFSLSVPASFGEELKDDLTTITEQVVAALDVGDHYTEFSGEFTDGIPARWYLYWSADYEYLSVTCAEDGTITNIYWGRNTGSYDRFYGYDAAFSPLSPEEARAQAEGWLTKLLAEGETARIDYVNDPKTSSGTYEFTGTILYHGLETPMNFTLSLGTDGINDYYRYNCLGDYIGELPGETANISAEDAANSLYDTIQLELYYVTRNGEARLFYVPVARDTIIEAETGKPVDMTALYASFGRSGVSYEGAAVFGNMVEETAAADKGMGRDLTEVELSSIDNYTDVLQKEDLDTAVRSLDALGLSAFTLDRCSYSMDEDGNITASLRYSCPITEDNLFGFSPESFNQSIGWGEQPVAMKYITLDARTAYLKSVSTSYSLWDNNGRKNVTDIQAAREFLEAAAPDMATESDVCTLDGYTQDTGITFTRLHDGYFFPENYLYVEINPATGAVDRYYYEWDKDMTFASSEALISKEDAQKAYAETLDVTLGFITWPEEIDYNDPILYMYADWGYTYVESLKLAYYYSGKNKVSGVDVLTGEVAADTQEQEIVYDDLEGSEQKDLILRLAQAGIGFRDGSFQPDRILTMQDAVILLVSSSGYYYRAMPEGSNFKDEAIQLGFITAEEWDPEKELTHSEFVHMIIGASRYGYTAPLEGLWNGEDGYMQIAAALGMLTDRTSAADDLCTRADAAEILYGFMNRAQ